MRPPERTRARVRVAISDPVLARAVSHALGEAPASVLREVDATIGDEDAIDPDVLVISSKPLLCSRALERISTGGARAVVTTDALDQLEHALRALARDAVYLPKVVIDQARRLPALNEREIDVLRGLLAGYSTPTLSLLVGLSERTLKRTIAELMTRLGVADRAGLFFCAHDLGIKPNGLTQPRPYAVSSDAMRA